MVKIQLEVLNLSNLGAFFLQIWVNHVHSQHEAAVVGDHDQTTHECQLDIAHTHMHIALCMKLLLVKLLRVNFMNQFRDRGIEFLGLLVYKKNCFSEPPTLQMIVCCISQINTVIIVVHGTVGMYSHVKAGICIGYMDIIHVYSSPCK